MYLSRDVAELLGLSVAQVRRYARSGFITPSRGARGEYRFSFQDLVILRTAAELLATRVPARKVRHALEQLKRQLPKDRPLTEVRISAADDAIVVRDGASVWNPESGQLQFDFAVSELASDVAPLARRSAEQARREPDHVTAEHWYEIGCELESVAPAEARDAYARALEIDPAQADAHVNLGRLLHEAGQLEDAERHYRAALEGPPHGATAAFNLGVVLEDRGRPDEAARAYRKALTADPGFADAHYNLASLSERLGNPQAALRHYKSYRDLTRGTKKGVRG